jgi:hypothetical protein
LPGSLRRSYWPSLGDLHIDFTREVFASAPDNVIVIRITADKPAGIMYTVTRTRQQASRSYTLDAGGSV